VASREDIVRQLLENRGGGGLSDLEDMFPPGWADRNVSDWTSGNRDLFQPGARSYGSFQRSLRENPDFGYNEWETAPTSSAEQLRDYQANQGFNPGPQIDFNNIRGNFMRTGGSNPWAVDPIYRENGTIEYWPGDNPQQAPPDPRTAFERSGGIAGLLGRGVNSLREYSPDFTRGLMGPDTPTPQGGDIRNWIYDRSAEAAGTVAGGIRDLSNLSGGYLRALTGGVPTGSQDPTDSFEDRFAPSGYPRGTPPWQNPDVWPDLEVTGGSNVNRFRLPAQNPDVWPPMQGTPQDLVPGTAGDIRRRLLGNSNITGGMDPTSAGADYTLGNVLTRGFSGAQNPDVWPNIQDSFADRFNFASRPSTDYTLPTYNPSGEFQDNFADRFTFASRPSTDYTLPTYNPSGGFQDSFVDRFTFPSRPSTDYTLPTYNPSGGFQDNFADRFNFSTYQPPATSHLSLPSGPTFADRYNLGANWQGPGGTGTIYDRIAAIQGGGTGYQSPTLTGGGGVPQNTIPAPPPQSSYGVMRLANAAYDTYANNRAAITNPGTYVSPYSNTPISTGSVVEPWQRIAPGGGALPNLTPGNSLSHGTGISIPSTAGYGPQPLHIQGPSAGSWQTAFPGAAFNPFPSTFY
jgi:hypothetical protein